MDLVAYVCILSTQEEEVGRSKSKVESRQKQETFSEKQTKAKRAGVWFKW
jgi:hypothetical protein